MRDMKAKNDMDAVNGMVNITYTRPSLKRCLAAMLVVLLTWSSPLAALASAGNMGLSFKSVEEAAAERAEAAEERAEAAEERAEAAEEGQKQAGDGKQEAQEQKAGEEAGEPEAEGAVSDEQGADAADAADKGEGQEAGENGQNGDRADSHGNPDKAEDAAGTEQEAEADVLNFGFRGIDNMGIVIDPAESTLPDLKDTPETSTGIPVSSAADEPVTGAFEDELTGVTMKAAYSGDTFGLSYAPELHVKAISDDCAPFEEAAQVRISSESFDKSLLKFFAYEITFTDDNDKIVEPVDGQTVKLSFQDTGFTDDEETEIKAYKYDKDTETLNEVTAVYDSENKIITIDADRFSQYGVALLSKGNVGVGKGITALRIRDFVAAGDHGNEATAKTDVDLLADPDAITTQKISWSAVGNYAYRLEVCADFFARNYDYERIIEIELADGMAFSGFASVAQLLESDDDFEAVLWEKHKKVNGYEPNGGKLTITLNKTLARDVYTKTISLLVVPDLPLISYPAGVTGKTLEDAIKVSVRQENAESEKKTLEKVDATADIRIRVDSEDYTTYPVYAEGPGIEASGAVFTTGTTKRNVIRGETITLFTSYHYKNFSAVGKTSYVNLKKHEVVFRVNTDKLEFSMKEPRYGKSGYASYVVSAPDALSGEDEGWYEYTFTRTTSPEEPFFGSSNMNYQTLYCYAKIPEDEAVGLPALITIKAVSSYEEWYDEEGKGTTYELNRSGNTQKAYLELTENVSSLTLSAYNDVRYFQKGLVDSQDDGQNRYRTVLDYATFYNRSKSESGPIIYEMEADTDKLFVDAVGIPCTTSGNKFKDGFLPTKIVVTDEDGKEYVLSTEEDIKGAAVKQKIYSGSASGGTMKEYQTSSSKGFLISSETLHEVVEYDTEKSIWKVQVWLPKYGVDSVTSNTGESYAASGFAACSVLGRLRASVEEGNTYKCVFTIRDQGSVDELGEYTLLKTASAKRTVKFAGLIDGAMINFATGYNSPLKVSLDKSVITPGETATLKIYEWGHQCAYTIGDSSITWRPVLWVPVPAGLTVTPGAFYDTADPETPLAVTVTDVTDKANANLPTGWKLLEYTFDKNVLINYFDRDWVRHELTGTICYTAGTSVVPLTFNFKDYLFSGTKVTGTASSRSSLSFLAADGEIVKGAAYGLSGATSVCAVSSNVTLSTTNSQEVNVTSAIRKTGDTNWTEYDGSEESLVVLKNDETLEMMINLSNHSGSPCTVLETYIPIPKTGLKTVFGGHFEDYFDECGFNLTCTGTTGNGLFDVTYGKVVSESEISDNGTVTPAGEWHTTAAGDDNFIKIALKESYEITAGTTETMVFSFSAAGTVDTRNIWKSSYNYQTGSGDTTESAVATFNNVCNFGCLLQNGVVSGTIYLDANRNGQKDEGESGIKDVTVTAVDENAKSYSTTTGADGKYSFDSLPGNKTMTLTVVNPQSPNPAVSGALRFTAKTASTATLTGSDVTPNAGHTQATAQVNKLSTYAGGQAVVNAGFVEPLTITFTEPNGGTVDPASVKLFAGQRLGDVLTQQPAVTPASGYTFQNKWTVGGETKTPSELMNLSFESDTVINAVMMMSVTVVMEKKTGDIVYDENPVVTAKKNDSGWEEADLICTYAGDGTISYTFYTDYSKGEKTSSNPKDGGAAGIGMAPKNAGTYYVVAETTETATCSKGISEPLQFVICKAELTTVAVTVTAPKKNARPDDSVGVGSRLYTAAAPVWDPAVSSTFLGGTVYTVSVKLTADVNHCFASGVAATVNGKSATFDAGTGTVSYTFDKTADRVLESISVITPPKTTYTYGQEADLKDLEISLNYDDGTKKTVKYNEHASGFSCSPSLPKVSDKKLEIGYSGKTVKQSISVDKKQVSVVWDTVTSFEYDGNAHTVTAQLGRTGTPEEDEVAFVFKELSAVNAGDYTAEITGLSGKDAGNYKLPSKSLTCGFTITKKKIEKVSLKVTAPAKGVAPASSATTTDTTYRPGTLTWTPAVTGSFQGNTVYTVSIPVTLTDSVNYEFDSKPTAEVNGTAATFKKGTISFTFDKTPEREITSIEISKAPDKTAYTYGETAELKGLELTVTYDDSTQETVKYDEHKSDFTVEPSMLKLSDNALEIGYKGKMANQTISVDKKQVSVVWNSETSFEYDGNAHTVTAQLGRTGTPEEDEVAFVFKDLSAVNAGDYTAEITGLSGKDAGNYKLPSEGLNCGFTITKKKIEEVSLTVTAPVKGAEPDIVAVAAKSTYRSGLLNWTPAVPGIFQGDTVYTVFIPLELTDEANYEFAAIVTAKVNDTAASLANGRVSFTFEKTKNREITGIEISKAPDKTAYTYGEAADLAGLELTVRYDDGTQETAVYNDKPDAFGYAPMKPAAADSALTISYGGKTAAQTIRVSKAPLTVTALPATITAGSSPVNNGVRIEGFVNGDTEETALTGRVVYTYTYTPGNAAGSYDIIPSGLTAANYAITYVKGELTVTRSGGGGGGGGGGTGGGGGSGSGTGKKGYNVTSGTVAFDTGTIYIYDKPMTAGARISTGGWVLRQGTDGSWMFKDENGNYAKSGWIYIKDPYSSSADAYTWFYFYENGIMATGWVLNPDGNWYKTDSEKTGTEGRLYCGWYQEEQDGKNYYLDPSTGIMATGWRTIEGKTFYFAQAADTGAPSWSAFAEDQSVITDTIIKFGAGGTASMVRPAVFATWRYTKPSEHPMGSRYENTVTPDGTKVGADGAKQ